MKKILFLTVLLCSAVLLHAQTRRVVDNVAYENANSHFFKINRIVADKAETRVEMSVFGASWHSFSIKDSAHLRGCQTGTVYKLLCCEGVTLNEDFTVPAGSNSLKITLYFEPVSSKDEAVDFREGENSGWLMTNIALQGWRSVLSGNWEAVGAPGNVVLVVNKDKLLYDGNIWDYTVKSKGKKHTFFISAGSVSRQLFVEQKKDGKILLRTESKGDGRLLTREAQRPLEQQAYSYAPHKANPLFFNCGTAYVKGVYTNIPQEHKGATFFNVTMSEEISNTSQLTSVTLNDDGTFFAKIEIPYPQYLFFDGPQVCSLFAVPGDTLVCILDCDALRRGDYDPDNIMPVLGNSLAAQVNRYDNKVTSLLNFNNASLSYSNANRVYSVSPEKMYEYSRKITDRLAQILNEGPSLLANLPLSARAKDLLITNSVVSAFQNALSVLFYYKMKDDNNALFEREKYLNFVNTYSDELLNNPYFLSASAGVIFNYAAFQMFFESVCRIISTKIPEYMNPENPETKKALTELNSGCAICAPYSSTMLDIADYNSYESVFTADKFWAEYFDAKSQYYYDNCFLLQASAGQLLEEGMSVDGIIAHIAGILQNVTDPIVGREFLNLLRRTVREQEGGATEKEMPNDIAEFMDGLYKKYPGEHIMLDFWSLGCGPCRQAMVEIHPEFVEKYAGRVRFVYICDELMDSAERVAAFFEENNLKGESLRISHSLYESFEAFFNFTGIPFMKFVTKDGEIRHDFPRGIYDDGKWLEDFFNE